MDEFLDGRVCGIARARRFGLGREGALHRRRVGSDQVQAAGCNALEALAASTIAIKDDLHLLEHLPYSPRLAELPDQDVDTTTYVGGP